MTAGDSAPGREAETGSEVGPEPWRTAPRDRERERGWLKRLEAAGFSIDDQGQLPCGGVSASVDPSTGDPQLVAVYLPDEERPWRVDRRTMRVNFAPSEGPEARIRAAADLADRVQLELGTPVLVRWGMGEDRVAVQQVRAVELTFCFTNASYRRTAALMADPGTLAPLAIDAIDRALATEEDVVGEPRVRRLYGQAYRRLDPGHTPWADLESTRIRAARVARKLARLGRDVAAPLAEARRFRRGLRAALDAQDREQLEALDTEDLLECLRGRAMLVVQALALLERSRLATLSLLPPLRWCVGAVPRERFAALAAPLRTRTRRAIDARLIALAERCRAEQGRIGPPDDPNGALRREWDRTRRALGDIRVLGMDVRPAPVGSDDAHLTRGILEALAHREGERDAARFRAEASLRRAVGQGALGCQVAAPTLEVVLGLLFRLATAKGSISEGLSAALLRMRAAALEVGSRLAVEGVIDVATDAFYLTLDELEDALRGELGAYAARVRLRREDDRRWRHFDAPRFIPGRRQ